MKKLLFIGFLTFFILLSGCIGPSEQTTSVGISYTTVDIRDFAFFPAVDNVSNGTRVIWTNKDSTPHTITGKDFDSGPISQSQAFSHTFNKTGTFEYHCTIHSNMNGNVIVT